jgi:hypothetical protein
MGRILEYLKDPSWWFTALFVGMIASLLAGYLKDWIPLVASQYSVTARRRRRKRLVRMARQIIRIKRDPRLLLSHMARLIIDFIFILFGFLFLLLAPPLVFFYENHPEYDHFGLITQPFRFPIIIITLPIMGILMLSTLQFFRRIYVFNRVYYEIRRFHKILYSDTLNSNHRRRVWYKN